MSKVFHVIPHTHWDSEWYFTDNESLIQLIYHMDEVMCGLESGINKTYLIDGQIKIIEDYLKYCPDQKSRLVRLVSEGKLLIGPWYTQTDTLIISGESIVRNLALGMNIGDRLGRTFNIGYVPDCFGQSQDLPKIYNGFGINKTVFWRGLSSDKCASREFIWNCPDGSQVLSYNIKNGYFSGVSLMDENDPNLLCVSSCDGALAKNVVIPLGGDQRYIDKNLHQQLAINNKALKNGLLIESNYEKFFSELSNESLELPHIEGELIEGEVSKIHRSIYSSRYDHKLLNDKVERTLVYQLEPLSLIAEKFGIPVKHEAINNIWKILLCNHAHDSAGACNTDKTNKIILSRFEKADQLSSSMVDYLVRKLSISQDSLSSNGANESRYNLTIFNTLPFKRTSLVKTIISTTTRSFSLLDRKEQQIHFCVINQEKHYGGSINRHEQDNDPNDYYFETEIAFPSELPSSGFVTYQVIENKENLSAFVPPSPPEARTIENSKYKISFESGKFSLFNKELSIEFDDFIRFIDVGDDGDTYDYSPPLADKKFQLDWSLSDVCIVQNDLNPSFIASGRWKIPLDLGEREKAIASGHLDYKIEIGLCDGIISINGTFDNQAKDHKVQMLISSPLSNENWSDTPFGVVCREDEHIYLNRSVENDEKDWRDREWKEEPSSIYPMLHFVNKHNDETSTTVLSAGIKEYEIVNKEIALTIFRSVGWLGKPNLTRRPGIASGQQFKYIETPDSQMIGHIQFNCGVIVEKKFDVGLVQRAWQSFAIPTLTYQCQSFNKFTTPLQYFVMHPLKAKVPTEYQGIEVLNHSLVVSAMKESEDGTGVIIRLYNPNRKLVNSCKIRLPEDFDYICDLNLREKVITEKKAVHINTDIGQFRPSQIRTILIGKSK